MKTIVILSSIFYILGLKISHKIDLVKRCNPVEKIASTATVVKETTKTFYFGTDTKTTTVSDTIKCEPKKNQLENK